MIITNPGNGRQFLVRIVFKGERYGRDDCLVHEYDEPLIEFYARSHAAYGGRVTDTESKGGFGPRGQFCSRYNASTLAEHGIGYGLCLAGGFPDWNVDAQPLEPVIATARALLVGLVPEDPTNEWSRWVTAETRLAFKNKGSTP